MATVDVTIMGAGIFGLSIAWECQRQGARVQIIDPAGVGAGASGGVVGALAPHTPERWEPKKDFQFESLVAANDFWSEVDAISGLSSGYGRTGRLQPIMDNHTLDLAKERAIDAKRLWRGQASWQVRDRQEFDGWVPEIGTDQVVFDTLTARIDPRRACESLAEALRLQGTSIERNAPEKGAVLWATGYQGLLGLSSEFGIEAGNGVKGQAALLRYDAGMAPQIFANGVHIIPHDNGTVGVGSTSERYFDDPHSTDEKLNELLERAFAVCPVLSSAPVMSKWAGVRPRAITRAPMLGNYPDRPGHFIANGGFKIGFGMAPKVATVMADLILDNVNNIPPEFRVETVIS